MAGVTRSRVWRRLLLAWSLALLALFAGCAVQTAALRSSPPEGLPPSVELSGAPFFPQTEWMCGPAALATALGAAGIDTMPEVLTREVFVPAREGSLQLEMLAGARRHGAVATRIPGTLAALLREVAAGHVVVVLQNLGLSFVPRWHYAVVVSYDLGAGELLMRSGTTRRDRIAMRTFEHTWARSGHWAFVVLPPGQWPVTAQVPAVVEAAVGFERVATPAQALRVYGSARERWPHDLTLAIGEGTAAYALGDGRRAVDLFRAAGERHGSGAAWINLSRVLAEQGDRAGALAAAERALGDAAWAGEARAWWGELRGR